MSKVRCMPALSTDEIRKISETAVANVAAQRLVTNKSAFASIPLAGKVMSKSSQSSIKQVFVPLSSTGSGLLNRARILAGSVLTQSIGRQYFQESFNQFRKKHKA